MKTAKQNESRNPSLAREITIALLLKVALLTFLWWAFFSHPSDKQTIANAVAERIFGGAQNISLNSRRSNHD